MPSNHHILCRSLLLLPTVNSGWLCADCLLMHGPLLVIWPEAYQHWSLQPVEWVRVLVQNVDLWESSLQSIFPVSSTTSVLAPTVSYWPSPPQETVLREVEPRSPWRYCFVWGTSAHETCAHPPRVDSLLPPALWGVFTQALLTFKAKCSRGSSPQCQTLRLSWRAIFLWEHPFVVCVGLMLFGTRAIFSIDVCHLFSQCVLAIPPW